MGPLGTVDAGAAVRDHAALAWIAALLVAGGLGALAHAATSPRADWLALLGACGALIGAWAVVAYLAVGG